MSRAQAGFTVLELVITLVLLGLALGAVAGTIRLSLVMSLDAEQRLDVQQNLRVAVEKVAEETRWAEAVLGDPECGGLCADRLTVRVPAANPRRPGQSYVVTFRRDGAQRELERRLGRAVNVLAAHIDGLSFRYLDPEDVPTTLPERVARVELAVDASLGSPPLRRTLLTGVLLRNARVPPSPP